MADNFFGLVVPAGSTSLSVGVELRSSTTGQGLTGLTASSSGLTASYWRQGGSATQISLVTLAGVTSAYSSGGFIEVSSTLQKGIYRLDIPNAAFASGADWVRIQVFTSNSYEWNYTYYIYTDPEQSFADALLNRDMSAVSDTNARTPLNALRLLRNKHSVASGVLTVYEEDDSTAAWTASVTSTASANPITAIDPA